ncbi:MAG: hypothetical protein A2Y14_02990 [Verrucomicrobia bacterium GWF2_51_19]|nr:MAG: hypothetical protein A2Y14_02990 [Verrucomicrobia bacterium GWF2_51_19]HCJ11579.1 hypothetical protein [Opitutae bacterium]
MVKKRSPGFLTGPRLQDALDAPLESSTDLGSRLWRTPSALGSGFGCKKQDIGMDLSLFLDKKSSFFVKNFGAAKALLIFT